MMVIRAAPKDHIAWLASRVHFSPTESVRALEAVDGDEILGMVGFDVWMGNAAQMHFAFESPVAARRLVREAMTYVFSHKDMVIGWLPEDRERLRKMAELIGFREVHRFKDGWAKGNDLIMFELRREWCRFVGKA